MRNLASPLLVDGARAGTGGASPVLGADGGEHQPAVECAVPVLSRAYEMAERIARNAPLAVAAEEAFRQEDDAVRRIMRSADAKEGARAFAERRDPVYTGI